MLVLLPPSEGKTAPESGPALDLAALSLPTLTPARAQVLRSLQDLCGAERKHALSVLGLSGRQMAEVDRDADLDRAPAAPAWQVYTGVLFAALDLTGAGHATRGRLVDWVLVWSGLWGAVRLDDPIPAYRLSGAVTLPGVGRLTSFWRGPLRGALAEVVADQLVLDLRSGTYSSSWTGPQDRTVVGRVIHQQGDRRAPASHFNKATKGRLLRALAGTGAQPSTADELIDAIRAAGFRAEPAPTQRPGTTTRPAPVVVDIVVDSL